MAGLERVGPYGIPKKIKYFLKELITMLIIYEISVNTMIQQ
jgi:hypothetical protein